MALDTYADLFDDGLEALADRERTCSPGWTRTINRAINSRKLCQLSYRGPLPRRRGRV